MASNSRSAIHQELPTCTLLQKGKLLNFRILISNDKTIILYYLYFNSEEEETGYDECRSKDCPLFSLSLKFKVLLKCFCKLG